MANGTAKPLALVKGHRTKAEKELRENAEKQLTSEQPFSKWDKTRKNAVASEFFDKLNSAFSEIGLNDILYESVINRYCIMLGECEDIDKRKQKLQSTLRGLSQKKRFLEVSLFFDLQTKLYAQIATCDSMLDRKRDKLLQIEKECCMTPLAKLRAIPKKPAEESEEDPMEKLLGGG